MAGREFGKLNPIALKGNLAGLYKLREGDYRIVYQILRGEKVIIMKFVSDSTKIKVPWTFFF